MSNRLTRDQIILRALNHIDSPRLDEKCRAGASGPGGTVTDPCLMTQWLQDGIDLAHVLYPLRGLLKTSTYTLVRGTGTYTLPADYVTHYPDGVILTDFSTGKLIRRLPRRGLDKSMQIDATEQSWATPMFFTVAGTTTAFQVRPIPDKSYTAVLHYYSLPAVLGATDVPLFPSDYLLVEYLVERGREWLREVPPGTANIALKAAMSQLVMAGIGQETEEDQIRVDRDAFPGSQDGVDYPSNWMGDTLPG